MLIFDSFADHDAAALFVAAVKQLEPELQTFTFGTVAEAQAHDPIPVQLVPVIVHVERPYDGNDSAIEHAREQGFADDTPTGREREEALEQLVAQYHGTYVGT